MTFKDLNPGIYRGHIRDYGLEEVEKLNNKIKVIIEFDLELEGGWLGCRWEGFLENKDGTPNKNTIKTLVTCGFQGSDPIDLSFKEDLLNKNQPFALTVERVGEYNRIKWINLPGAIYQGIKKAKIARKSSEAMRMAVQEAKNAGPKQSLPKEEDLPF